MVVVFLQQEVGEWIAAIWQLILWSIFTLCSMHAFDVKLDLAILCVCWLVHAFVMAILVWWYQISFFLIHVYHWHLLRLNNLIALEKSRVDVNCHFSLELRYIRVPPTFLLFQLQQFIVNIFILLLSTSEAFIAHFYLFLILIKIL